MSTDRDAVIRHVAQQVAGILLSDVDEEDEELMQEIAHDAGHDFPVHVEEYRQVRRLIRGAHIVLPSEES